MKFLFGLIITVFIIFSGSLFAQEKIQLAVVLATNGEPDKPPPRLSGFYIYIDNGKEIKKEFQTDGGYAWNFYGEYFTKVEVKRTGGVGSYQLFVAERDDTVFSTGLVEHTNPTIYMKNEP